MNSRVANAAPPATAPSLVSEKLLRGQSLGFLLLKCQETLKAAGRPLATFDFQLALTNSGPSKEYPVEYYAALFADNGFTTTLRSNSRIEYDPKAKRWSFVSPYAAFTSIAKLKEGIDQSPLGLEVAQELLECHPQMADWIYKLLEQRQVRAVRTGKTVKCRNFAPDSGFQCDLYEARSTKCDNCALLKNITLYGKARPDADDAVAESDDANYKLDEDLKEMWASIQLPAMEAILEELRTKQRAKQLENKKKPRRRGPGSRAAMDDDGGQANSRVHRIANAHIYSMEEFKAELGKRPAD